MRKVEHNLPSLSVPSLTSSLLGCQDEWVFRQEKITIPFLLYERKEETLVTD
jgi:hypothetical protein